MSAGLTIAVLIVLLVLAMVVVRVLQYARKSRQQWEDVDKSKLKTWDDDGWK
jgi:hypothetical protein